CSLRAPLCWERPWAPRRLRHAKPPSAANTSPVRVAPSASHTSGANTSSMVLVPAGKESVNRPFADRPSAAARPFTPACHLGDQAMATVAEGGSPPVHSGVPLGRPGDGDGRGGGLTGSGLDDQVLGLCPDEPGLGGHRS